MLHVCNPDNWSTTHKQGVPARCKSTGGPRRIKLTRPPELNSIVPLSFANSLLRTDAGGLQAFHISNQGVLRFNFVHNMPVHPMDNIDYCLKLDGFRKSDEEREQLMRDLVARYADLRAEHQNKLDDLENEVTSRRILKRERDAAKAQIEAAHLAGRAEVEALRVELETLRLEVKLSQDSDAMVGVFIDGDGYVFPEELCVNSDMLSRLVSSGTIADRRIELRREKRVAKKQRIFFLRPLRKLSKNTIPVSIRTAVSLSKFHRSVSRLSFSRTFHHLLKQRLTCTRAHHSSRGFAHEWSR